MKFPIKKINQCPLLLTAHIFGKVLININLAPRVNCKYILHIIPTHTHTYILYMIVIVYLLCERKRRDCKKK